MWSKIVSDTFKLQTNGYPHNHFDILTVFDRAVLLYQRLSDRNNLINKIQAGDILRLERSILASKKIKKASVYDCSKFDVELHNMH
jgi:hypothetical protein